MIEKIRISKKDRNGKVSRVGNLAAIAARNGEFVFKPGLNVIIGSNGSGKTSLVKSIAHELAATNFGFTHIDKDWCYQKTNIDDNSISGAMSIDHDGQVVFYSDTKVSVPVVDESNMAMSLSNAMLMFGASRESTGEHAMKRIAPILEMLERKPVTQMIGISDEHQGEFRESLESHFSPKIEVGQPTLIMDEPDMGLGMLFEAHFWQVIQKAALEKNYQIIMVSHSSKALHIDGANYIEMEDGYRDACLAIESGMPLTHAMHKMSFSGGIELNSDEEEILIKLSKNPEGLIYKGINPSLKKLIDFNLVDLASLPNEDVDIMSDDFLDSLENPESVYFLTVKGSDYTKKVLKKAT